MIDVRVTIHKCRGSNTMGWWSFNLPGTDAKVTLSNNIALSDIPDNVIKFCKEQFPKLNPLVFEVEMK